MLPCLSDEANLPYVRAVLHETHRSSSLLVNGVPRRASEDIVLSNGMVIPENTAVFANMYQIHHDPEYWRDPQKFWPERFLDASGAVFTPDERVLPFGIGRRVCPGQTLAEKEFFLFFTAVMLKFRVAAAPGTELPGHGILDTPVTGIVRKPPTHYLTLTPRNLKC